MHSFFRFLTLVGFRIFLELDLDVVILEVGMGGRMDATNVVQKPVVCGITLLDLDHTSVLGNTLEEIAHEVLRSVRTAWFLFLRIRRKLGF